MIPQEAYVGVKPSQSPEEERLKQAYAQAYATGYQTAGFSPRDVEYIAPPKPTTTQVLEYLQTQVPPGAIITYAVEKTPGQYYVTYKMPEETKKEETKIIKASLGQPITDFLRGIIEAPTWSELEVSMRKSPIGTAIPIKTEEVVMAAVVIGTVVGPRLVEPTEKLFGKLPSKVRYEYYGLESTLKAELSRVTVPAKTFYYKHFTPMGKWEARFLKELSWVGQPREASLGFQRAFPTDVQVGTFKYATYPGFEFWTSTKEAHKLVGYPVLRSLAAAPIQAARVSVEKSIWGPSQIIFGTKEQIASFETWASAVEAHPYAGYPVIYRDVVGISFAEKPTAWQQIMKGIEKGMFWRMGGLAATQVPVFAKPTISQRYYYPELPSTRATGKTYVPLISEALKATKPSAPLLFPSIPSIPKELIKPRGITIIKPTVKPTEVWEREKQKFAPIVVPKKKERQVSITVPKVEVKAAQKAKPITIPSFAPTPPPTKLGIPVPIPTPSPMVPKVPTITVPQFRLGGGDSGMKTADRAFAKWFKKMQQIKTPGQMIETYFGKRRKRK